MLAAFKYGLANVTNFQGRDARQTFWYYMLLLFIGQFLVSMIVSIPMYISLFTGMFEAMSNGMSEQEATRTLMVDMIDQIKTQAIIGAVLNVVVALLFVASFVRRLHDAGFTGWIALAPLATQAFSVIYSLSYLDKLEEMMVTNMDNMGAAGGDPFAMQAEMGLYGMVGYVGYIIVIIFGVFRSEDGANKYGEEPVSF